MSKQNIHLYKVDGKTHITEAFIAKLINENIKMFEISKNNDFIDIYCNSLDIEKIEEEFKKEMENERINIKNIDENIEDNIDENIEIL